MASIVPDPPVNVCSWQNVAGDCWVGRVGVGVLAVEAEGVDPQAAKTTANSIAAKTASKPRKCLCFIVILSLAR